MEKNLKTLFETIKRELYENEYMGVILTPKQRSRCNVKGDILIDKSGTTTIQRFDSDLSPNCDTPHDLHFVQNITSSHMGKWITDGRHIWESSFQRNSTDKSYYEIIASTNRLLGLPVISKEFVEQYVTDNITNIPVKYLDMFVEKSFITLQSMIEAIAEKAYPSYIDYNKGLEVQNEPERLTMVDALKEIADRLLQFNIWCVRHAVKKYDNNKYSIIELPKKYGECSSRRIFDDHNSLIECFLNEQIKSSTPNG